MSNPTLGSLIDKLAEVRMELSDLNNAVKDLKEQKEDLEHKILDLLNDVGLDRASNDRFTVSKLSNVVPSVTDWDALYEFIRENDAMYMLQRRLLASAYRELVEERDGEDIPGVAPFEQVTLSFRTLS